MNQTERVRLIAEKVNVVIEVPSGAQEVQHEGRTFQRTGLGHSIGADEPIPSFHPVKGDKPARA